MTTTSRVTSVPKHSKNLLHWSRSIRHHHGLPQDIVHWIQASDINNGRLLHCRQDEPASGTHRACSQLQLIELTVQLCRGMERMQMRLSKHSSTDHKSGDENKNIDVPWLPDQMIQMMSFGNDCSGNAKRHNNQYCVWNVSGHQPNRQISCLEWQSLPRQQ